MYFKKQNLSFILAFLLIILMYNTPQSLKNFSKQTVGRVVLVCILLYFALDCDLACAIIFASMIVVLLHDNKEGMLGGQLKKLADATTANVNQMGFKGKEGMDEGTDHNHVSGNHTHGEEEDEETGSSAAAVGSAVAAAGTATGTDTGSAGTATGTTTGSTGTAAATVAAGTEGFIGLNNMKDVTNKLRNYLGFSITDLDRFMKTSGEKNTMLATKDHK